MKTYAIRLNPGEDLRERLVALAAQERWDAACILSATGNLSRAAIRFAGQHGPSVTEGKLELISLTGTLSRFGMELKICVAGETGKVLAGRLDEGCEIRNTAEIIIGILPGLIFKRAKDKRTGQHELIIERD